MSSFSKKPFSGADGVGELSLVDLARRIRSGALSSATVVSAFLDRIESLDSRILAWTAIARETAIDRASQRDREREHGQIRGSLHGVPIGIKDVFDTAGIRTGYGSQLFADHVPVASAEAVRRLEDSGAIVIGKLATSEFAALDPAPTRNPRNPAHTPGGSSSGSAAAVAARMCPAALGTQTAGSIGRPAAFCGVVGCMPTQARVPRQGVFPAARSLDHVGAFGGSVDDVRVVVESLSGVSFDRGRDDTGVDLRVGVVGGYFQCHADPAAWDIHEAFIERLRHEPGIRVADVGLPDRFEESVLALWTIMKAEIATVHRERYPEHAEVMGRRIGALIQQGLRVPATAYLDALETRREFQTRMAALFRAVDVLVSPGAPGPAPKGHQSTGDPVMNAPWTFADLPTLSLPITFVPASDTSSDDVSSLPLGIQISAPSLGESALFSAARRIEQVACS